MRAFPQFLGLIVAGLCPCAHSVYAFATLEHGRLVGSATARVDYDSNIFVSHSQVSDTVGTVDGNVQYVRDAGIVTLESTVGLVAMTFADHSDQNTADPYLDAKLGYVPSDKTTIRTALDYRRSTIANEFVNARTRSDDLTLNGSAEYLATEKLGWRALADYVSNKYLTHGYSDPRTYDVGLYGVYVYSPKLKLLAGATYLESWTTHRATVGQSPANSNWRYALGAEGEIAPKITGNINVGVTHRSFTHAGFSGSTDAYLSSQLSWAAAEKTTWSLLASRSLGLTAADQSVRAFDVSLQVVHQLSQKLSLEGSAGWSESSFQSYLGLQNRNDHGYTLRARLAYAVSETLSCDVSGGYRDNSSSLLTSTYDRVNLGAGVVMRF
jgi:polysaccharide biosynthesis protein VpsM